MSLDLILIGILATYRLTLLFNSEIGPGRILECFRYWIGVRFDERSAPYATNWRAEAVLCPYCLSVWFGFVVGAALIAGAAAQSPWAIYLLFPFALSGGAVFLKKWVG